MTTRAITFADRWLKEHADEALDGPVSASELADRLIADAENEGIPADEMDADVGSRFGSVFELVYAAVEYNRVEDMG
jgi:hypothetical protein